MKNNLYVIFVAIFIILTIMFAFIPGEAQAEEIDLGSMSMEDLVYLKAEIDALLANNDSAFLPQGAYLCGRDIAPGTYIATVTWTDGFAMIATEDANRNYITNSGTVDVGSMFRFTLNEGEYIDLCWCNCTVSRTTNTLM